ncbi:MAG TPA: GGDEF domain-containing protein [Pseudomonadales bacterium]|nr:GGDEF domain-containing protein [Pseudomonadales bacterium]
MSIAPLFFIISLMGVIAVISSSVLYASYMLDFQTRSPRTLKFFQMYFYGGGIGWIALCFIELLNVVVPIAVQVIPFYLATYLLLYMLADSVPFRKYGLIWLGSNVLFVVGVLLSDSIQATLWNFAIYNLIHMTVLLLVSLKLMRNVGDRIIALAIFLPLSLSLLQMYNLTKDNHEIVIGIGLISSATSFSLVALGFMTMNLVSHRDSLQHLADIDPLTGLYNRRGLDARLARLTYQNLHNPIQVSAVACDIDHFKRINDRYGHDVGDIVIKEYSSKLLELSRNSDIVARLGGEEFALILPQTDMEDAIKLAERLREAIEKTDINVGADQIKLTSSFGVAGQFKLSSTDELMKEADKQLYRAKETGRNRVVADLNWTSQTSKDAFQR